MGPRQEARIQQKKSNQVRTAQEQRPASGTPEVVVTDVDISFGNMVMLLVKLALASIPALFIVWIVMAVLGGFMMELFGIGGGMMGGDL